MQYWPNRDEYLGIDSFGRRIFPTMSPEAARFLAKERQVYGVGFDTISPDASAPNKPHRELFAQNVYVIENLANLHLVPPTGARAIVLPMKISGSSGAPVRVLAVLP